MYRHLSNSTLYAGCSDALFSGGGNVYNLRAEGFGPALRWMLYEAIDFGLSVRPSQIGQWKGPAHHPSMNRFWKAIEYIPIPRLSYGEGKGDRTHTWQVTVMCCLMLVY